MTSALTPQLNSIDTLSQLEASVSRPESFASLFGGTRELCAKLAKDLELLSVRCVVDCETTSPETHLIFDPDDQLSPTTISRGVEAACRTALEKRHPTVHHLLAPDRTIASKCVDTESGHRFSIGLCVLGQLKPATIDWLLSSLSMAVSNEMQAAELGTLERCFHQTTAVIDLVERIAECKYLRSATQVVASQLHALMPDARVAVGYRRAHKSACQLQSISDSAIVDRRAKLSVAIESLMNDTAHRTQVVVWRGADQKSTHSAFARLADTLGNHRSVITTIPLLIRGSEWVGTIVIIQPQPNTQSELAVQFATSASPSIASALVAADRQRSSGLSLAMQTLFAKLGKPGKTVCAICVLLVATVMAIPTTHKISCSTQLEPVQRRFVAAPFDGNLARALVKPGDLVVAGDVIARMDDRDIKWKRASVVADQNQSKKKRDTAQATKNYSEQQIAQLEMEQHEIELRLLDDRISRLDITSPMKGVITSGDLARVEGAPLSVGQTLFEIAPLNKLLVEVEVDDSKIAYVRAGHKVDVQFDAYPSQVWNATIDAIRPRAEIRSNKNVFVAEVELRNDQDRLRPGMKGTAKIQGDQRPYVWILFHEPMEFLVKRITW
ncbi:MAG: efflux RND transporter periplasmic adaptor subunit [Pirellula sp.]